MPHKVSGLGTRKGVFKSFWLKSVFTDLGQSPQQYSLGSGTNKTLVKKPVVSPANFYFNYKVCKTAEKEKKSHLITEWKYWFLYIMHKHMNQKKQPPPHLNTTVKCFRKYSLKNA